MKYVYAALAACFLVVSVAHAFALDAAKMNVQIDETNFLMNNNCSATLIDKDKGILLTANHCIQSQFDIVTRQKFDDQGKMTEEKVRVSRPGTVSRLFFKGPNEVQRNVYGFKIVKADDQKDLAIVQVQATLTNRVDAKISCVAPQRLDPVYAVGNTRAILYATVSNGIVSSVNRDGAMIGDEANGEQGFVQTTTAVAGGNSGGALYNNKGEIIGVVVRGYQAVAPIALSVPLDSIQGFLKGTEAGPKVECK